MFLSERCARAIRFDIVYVYDVVCIQTILIYYTRVKRILIKYPSVRQRAAPDGRTRTAFIKNPRRAAI